MSVLVAILFGVLCGAAGGVTAAVLLGFKLARLLRDMPITKTAPGALTGQQRTVETMNPVRGTWKASE